MERPCGKYAELACGDGEIRVIGSHHVARLSIPERIVVARAARTSALTFSSQRTVTLSFASTIPEAPAIDS